MYVTICQSLIVRTTKGVFLGKIAIRLSTSFFAFCTDHVINYPKLDIHGKSWKSLSAQNMALFVSSVTLLLYQASLRPKKWTITIGIWESFDLGKHIKYSKKYRVIWTFIHTKPSCIRFLRKICTMMLVQRKKILPKNFLLLLILFRFIYYALLSLLVRLVVKWLRMISPKISSSSVFLLKTKTRTSRTTKSFVMSFKHLINVCRSRCAMYLVLWYYMSVLYLPFSCN